MEDVGVAVGARLGGIFERVWSDMGEGVVVFGGGVWKMNGSGWVRCRKRWREHFGALVVQKR